jgi:hypothetical protein
MPPNEKSKDQHLSLENVGIRYGCNRTVLVYCSIGILGVSFAKKWDLDSWGFEVSRCTGTSLFQRFGSTRLVRDLVKFRFA